MKISSILKLAVCLFVLGVLRSEAQILLNGSFEGYTGSTTTFVSGNSTSWSSVTSVPYWIPTTSTTFNVPAEDGTAFVGLQANVGQTPLVYQSVTGLTIGQTYEITLYVRARNTAAESGTWSVLMSGATMLGSYTGQAVSGTWTQEVATFVATSTNQNINLKWAPANNGDIIFFDNVSITAVPEPNSLTLGAAGLAGLLLLLRTRQVKSLRLC